jgi:hypothetical protein
MFLLFAFRIGLLYTNFVRLDVDIVMITTCSYPEIINYPEEKKSLCGLKEQTP